MVIYPQLELARAIAFEAHHGQVDKQGLPYIAHVARVASRMTIQEAAAMAWLHDVVEDTKLTPDDLRRCGVDDRLIAGVVLLTNKREPMAPSGNYVDYIQRVIDGGDDLALAVKVSELLDHLQPFREAGRFGLRAKYDQAWEQLLPHLGRVISYVRSPYVQL